jgi:hypothetical protein
MLVVDQSMYQYRTSSRQILQGDRIANSATTNLSTLTAMDLEQLLARAIADRTGGRIRMFAVQITGTCIVLRGCAPSYHAVQLAVAGLKELLQALQLDWPDRVELDIEVVPCGGKEQPPKNGHLPR